MNVLQTMEDVVTFVLTFLVIINVAVEVDTLWRKMVHAQVIPEGCIYTLALFTLKLCINNLLLLFSSTLSYTNETTRW